MQVRRGQKICMLPPTHICVYGFWYALRLRCALKPKAIAVSIYGTTEAADAAISDFLQEVLASFLLFFLLRLRLRAGV